MLRLALVVGLAGVLGGTAAGVVGAQGATTPAPTGTLEVTQVGWDGSTVPFTWSPVRLRAAAAGADLDARVEVVLKSRYQPGPQATPIEDPYVAYGQDVALPAGVTKDVTVWVPVDSNTVAAARLVAAGRTVVEQRVEFPAARTLAWPLVGVLADAPAVARSVAQVEIPVQGLPVPVGVARLTVGDVPVLAERLNAFSALVVQGNAAAGLTGAQREALLEWVGAGGHLVLAGGPDAPRAAAALPAGKLALTFTGGESAADLGGLARWAEAAGPPLAAGYAARFQAGTGAPIVGTLEAPLAWRTALGLGSVTLLAVDPALEPLASWGGTPALLRKALEPALPATGEEEKLHLVRQDRMAPQRLQGAVEALSPAAFPSWRVVGGLLGGFALLVGPVLHVVLRRTDRREWVWAAVPAAALLVSGALYVVGVGRGGRDVLVNTVAHLRLDPESGQARQALATGFYAPTHPQLTVSVAGDVPVRTTSQRNAPMAWPGQVLVPAAEPPVRVATGRETRVEFGSGQWGMRSVTLTRTLGEETGTIAAHLTLQEGLIRGTIKNDTPYFLEDAAVTVGQSLQKLGNLAPGQTAQVTLDPTSPANRMMGGQPFSWRYFGRAPGSHIVVAGGAAVSSRSVAVAPALPSGSQSAVSVPASFYGGPMERLELPREPEVQRRVRLMDSVLNVARPMPGPAGQTMPLTFYAFTQDAVGADVASAGNHPIYRLTLLEQQLRIELVPGRFTIPAGLMPPEIVAQTSRGMGGGGNGTLFWSELQSGSVTFAYRAPLPPGTAADALMVTTRQVGQSVAAPQGRGVPAPAGPGGPGTGTTPAEAGVFSIYNWTLGSWEPLAGGQEQVRLETAAPYVTQGGQVWVQVTAAADRVVRFIVPELTIEGTVR